MYLPRCTHRGPEDDLIQVETCSSEKSVDENLIVFGQVTIMSAIPFS
jgi:hypothetical protein